jgi:hypothetical protein
MKLDEIEWIPLALEIGMAIFILVSFVKCALD